MKNEEVVRAWLDNPDACLCNSNKTLWSEDEVLYSYGKHFPLAWMREGAVVVNFTKVSATTTRHSSLVATMAVMRGYEVVREAKI